MHKAMIKILDMFVGVCVICLANVIYHAIKIPLNAILVNFTCIFEVFYPYTASLLNL